MADIMPPVPLFDDIARDGKQGELAHIIRDAVLIRPFGPNSLEVHAAGGSVRLTPAESEEAARAVLTSGWLAAIRAEAWDQGYAAAYNDERESMPDHTKNPHRAGGAA